MVILMNSFVKPLHTICVKNMHMLLNGWFLFRAIMKAYVINHRCRMLVNHPMRFSRFPCGIPRDNQWWCHVRSWLNSPLVQCHAPDNHVSDWLSCLDTLHALFSSSRTWLLSFHHCKRLLLDRTSMNHAGLTAFSLRLWMRYHALECSQMASCMHQVWEWLNESCHHCNQGWLLMLNIVSRWAWV